MYAGRILETVKASGIASARHPYTRGLLNAEPRIEDARTELAVVPRDPAWLQEPAP